MNTHYGIWHFDGNAVDVSDFRRAGVLLSRYAPDGVSTYLEPSLGIVCGAFHTLPVLRRTTEPYRLFSGEVLVWDGRLDNRTELIRNLGGRLDQNAADIEIVAAWFRRWGCSRLADLIGDWALVVWEPKSRLLVLAKDFIGTRHLYYRLAKGYIAWSTVLDALAGAPKQTLTLCGEYLAACLSGLPAPHLTPYNEIRSVSPCSYLLVNEGRVTERRYWDFNPGRSIRYRSDGEYEAHFLDLFRQSVGRRLPADGTVLAELSGGMDSSSIVCVADDLIGRGEAGCRDLETISYFSASEPDWDEAPYFTKVEERRGRAGFHVNLGSLGFFRFGYDCDSSRLSPAAAPKTMPDEQIDSYFQAAGHRILLSGIGGDEFLGGVPTPAPELEDLIARFRFLKLAHQLKLWALAQRKPWIHLLAAAVRDFLPFQFPAGAKPAPWVRSQFAERHRPALAGYPDRIRLLGPLPSFQHAVGTVDVLRRSLAWSVLSPARLCEKRYPYLDRCLLEFLFAIPREQLLRPGQRRSLMRRAMRGIVPDEILTRKRKAFVSRAPLAALNEEWEGLVNGEDFLTASLGMVDHASLFEAMRNARAGREVPLVPLVRTLALECWLRHLASQRVTRDLEFAEPDSFEVSEADISQQEGGENDEIRKAGSCRAG